MLEFSDMKKYLLISILTLVFLVGYPGCRCDDFTIIRGISSVEFLDMETNTLIVFGSTSTDSLALQLSLEFETLHANALEVGTMSSALALYSCEVPLANQISSIKVTSNQDYNQFLAGTSLNSTIQIYRQFDTTPFTVEEYIQQFNESSEFVFYGYDPIVMRLTEKPGLPEHQFTVQLIDDSDNVFDFVTETINWN